MSLAVNNKDNTVQITTIIIFIKDLNYGNAWTEIVGIRLFGLGVYCKLNSKYKTQWNNNNIIIVTYLWTLIILFNKLECFMHIKTNTALLGNRCSSSTLSLICNWCRKVYKLVKVRKYIMNATFNVLHELFLVLIFCLSLSLVA